MHWALDTWPGPSTCFWHLGRWGRGDGVPRKFKLPAQLSGPLGGPCAPLCSPSPALLSPLPQDLRCLAALPISETGKWWCLHPSFSHGGEL